MIYLNNNMKRPGAIFAKQISHKLKLPISLFSVDEIYNIINQKCFVLIEQHNMQNQHLNNLLKDITVSNHTLQCKILLIGHPSSLEIENVISIKDSDFVCYDELHNNSEDENKNMIFVELSNTTKEQLNKLNNILYPNNKTIAVKAVNNSEFCHVQNLGLSTEKDSLKLLSECSYYVNINNMYLYDAVYANKKVLDIEDIPKLKNIENIDSIVINNNNYSNDITNKAISKILNKII